MRKLISLLFLVAIVAAMLGFSSQTSFAQDGGGDTGVPDDPDVFTFKELGYAERFMVGPYDNIDVFFSIPDNWKLAGGTYIQMEFSYTTPLYDQNARRVFYNSTTDEFFKGNSTWLRIARYDDRFVAYVSHDGQNWLKTGVVTTEFPAQVQVGIHAVNSAGAFAVVFDQFSIEKR